MARPFTITTEQILEAARATFLEHGLRATTAQVARRAGVAEGSIFKRFPTKHDLFFAAMQPSFRDPEFLQVLEGQEGAGDVRARMVELGTELMGFLRRMLPLIMMSWSHSRGPLPPHLATKDPPPVRALRLTTRYFAAEMRLGRLRRCDPEVLARALFGGVQNYVFHELIRKRRSTPKADRAYVVKLVDLLWPGIAPTPNSKGKRR